MSSRSAICLVLVAACVGVQPLSATDTIDHQMKIHLDSEQGFLRVQDAIAVGTRW